MCSKIKAQTHHPRTRSISGCTQSSPNIRSLSATLFPCVNNSKLIVAETRKISHDRRCILYKYFMQTGRAPRGILWAPPHAASKLEIRLSLKYMSELLCIQFKSRSKQWNKALLSLFHNFWTTLLFGHTFYSFFRMAVWASIADVPSLLLSYWQRDCSSSKKTHPWRSREDSPENLGNCYISQNN